MQTFAPLDFHRRRTRESAFWVGFTFLLALAAFLIALPAWAQEAAAPAADPTTQQVLDLLKFAGGAFHAGAYFAAGVAVIIMVVFALRLWGKKLHDLVPDESVLDKPLWFLFDTKPGGVLLNGLTTASVTLTPALLSGQKVTPVLAGASLLAGVGASQVYGWAKDLLDWWRARKPPVAPAQEAGLKAVEKPGSGVDA